MITRQEMGAIIKAARLEKGYTQRELGEKLGYERNQDTNVRLIEIGKTYPPYAKLRTISEVLGIPLDKLVP